MLIETWFRTPNCADSDLQSNMRGFKTLPKWALSSERYNVRMPRIWLLLCGGRRREGGKDGRGKEW